MHKKQKTKNKKTKQKTKNKKKPKKTKTHIFYFFGGGGREKRFTTALHYTTLHYTTSVSFVELPPIVSLQWNLSDESDDAIPRMRMEVALDEWVDFDVDEERFDGEPFEDWTIRRMDVLSVAFGRFDVVQIVVFRDGQPICEVYVVSSIPPLLVYGGRVGW